MPPARTDARFTLSSLIVAAALAVPAFAQTMPAMPNPGAAPTTLPAPNSAAAATAPEQTGPFVGTVTGEKVYVRSGPGNNYYEVGQLTKGDLVQVTEARLGWYKILPPNGTFCMIAKDFVKPDESGATGIVSGDYINVRAGTALYPQRDPSNVLGTVRKGAKVTILGSTDKYYEIAPPDNVRFYLSPQFVQKAPAEAAYKIPDLKLPSGVTGPSKTTVTAVPTALPPATVEISPGPTATTTPAGGAVTDNTQTPPRPLQIDSGNPPAATQTAIAPPPTTGPAIPPLEPATTFSATAYAKYQSLNESYQAELRKAPMERNYDSLIQGFQELAGQPDVAPSVKAGSDARVAALQKLAAIQKLAKENAASTDSLNQQRQALQQQYAGAEKAIEDYEKTGPYLAEGELRTSTTVQGKYALVNPTTGRVVAYVDPTSDIDIGSLVGKYIGVRGTSEVAPGTQVTVLHVRNATLLPAPESPAPAPTSSR